MVRLSLFSLCLVIPGLIVAVVCGYFALVDYSQLQADYSHFQAIARAGAGLQTVFVAYAAQDIHRTNLFAEGVWAMLGLIVSGLGLLGALGNVARK